MAIRHRKHNGPDPRVTAIPPRLVFGTLLLAERGQLHRIPTRDLEIVAFLFLELLEERRALDELAEAWPSPPSRGAA